MFCEYSEIFGKVNEGVHSYKIMNIAMVDVIATIIVAYLINMIYNDWPFAYILGGLFVLSIIMHRLFCVRTTIDKLLFP